MSMKKILSVLAIAALFSFFAPLDSGYASNCASRGFNNADRPSGEETVEGKNKTEEGVEKKKRKGSIYDGSSHMIANGIYKGNATTTKNFQQNSGINPDTSKPYSDSTIDRERNSMIKAGIVEQDGTGGMYVKAGINHDVLDAANKAIEKVVPRKEKGTGKALGLHRFNLADLPEEQLSAIAQIIENANLKNQAAVNIIAFESEFAEQHGEALLNIMLGLRPDQIPVIINATGRGLNLIEALREIHVEDVEPVSVAAQQFKEMFENQKYVGLKGDLDGLRKAIEQNRVAK